MDQVLVDTAVRRLRVKNKKEVTLLKSYFSELTHLASQCLNTLSGFAPSKVEPMTLRAGYGPMYKWLAVQLSDIYGFEVQHELLSGLKMNIDMVDGVIELQATLTYSCKRYNFHTTFNDETAPYSTKWPELVKKNGGSGDRFAQLMTLV